VNAALRPRLTKLLHRLNAENVSKYRFVNFPILTSGLDLGIGTHLGNQRGSFSFWLLTPAFWLPLALQHQAALRADD
jgi:hypothetical protein